MALRLHKYILIFVMKQTQKVWCWNGKWKSWERESKGSERQQLVYFSPFDKKFSFLTSLCIWHAMVPKSIFWSFSKSLSSIPSVSAPSPNNESTKWLWGIFGVFNMQIMSKKLYSNGTSWYYLRRFTDFIPIPNFPWIYFRYFDKVYIKSTMLVDACQILFIFSHFLNNFKELFPTCQNYTLYKGISYSVQ